MNITKYIVSVKLWLGNDKQRSEMQGIYLNFYL